MAESTRHVDLGTLAVDRESPVAAAPRRAAGATLVRFGLPVVLLALLAGLLVWSSRDLLWPARPVRIVPVLVSRSAPEREGEPLFKAAGWIEPRPTAVRVAALAGGVVQRLLVVEDQPLKQGEPIAELIDEDARLTCDKAEADLRLREAELQAAETDRHAARERFEQPVHLEASVAEAEAELASVEIQLAGLPFEVRRAEARRDFAQANYQGKSSVDGAVAGRVIQEARSQLDATQADLEELQQRGQGLQRRQQALARRRDALRKQLQLKTEERRVLQEAEAEVEAARARLRQAQVALDEARLQLRRMTIPAPIDGRVLHLVAQPGSRLLVGGGHSGGHDAGTVVTMYRPEMLQVRVDVRFDNLAQVHVGQAVSLSSPAVSEPLQGRVLFVGSEADIQKNTLEVKVAVDNPRGQLKPEMLVDVTFLATRSSTDGDSPRETSEPLRMFVPRRLTFTSDDAGRFVWVADQTTGTARKVPVELGVASGNGMVEVLGGIHPASRLIADGHTQLRDGQRIRIVGEAPPAPDSTRSL